MTKEMMDVKSTERKYLEFLHPDAPRPRGCDQPNQKTIKGMIEKGWIIVTRDKGYPLSRNYEITSTGLIALADEEDAAAIAADNGRNTGGKSYR